MDEAEMADDESGRAAPVKELVPRTALKLVVIAIAGRSSPPNGSANELQLLAKEALPPMLLG